MANEFLGKGWAFPVRLDIDSEISLSPYEQDVEESIRIILATAPGERVMKPDFGCGIHNYLFDTLDTPRLTLMQNSISEALILWEPRIQVNDITPSTARVSEGIIEFNVSYLVRKTDNRFNLVYPFYIQGERT